MGKGSTRRPFNRKKWEENYEQIFGKKEIKRNRLCNKKNKRTRAEGIK